MIYREEVEFAVVPAIRRSKFRADTTQGERTQKRACGSDGNGFQLHIDLNELGRMSGTNLALAMPFFGRLDTKSAASRRP